MPQPTHALLRLLSSAALASALWSIDATCLTAQSPAQTAVQVTAQVGAAPPAIAFTWPADATATGYTVYRRLPGALSWGAATTIPGGGAATGWVDTNVAVGVHYDYWFLKSGSVPGRGFLAAGIEVPAVEHRGKVVLVVDASKAVPLARHIDRLIADLVGDGWQVVRLNVQPTQTAASVKAGIVAIHNADPTNVKAVFLLGRVPVPYSGVIFPDGHPDHRGAWPADLYYGDMDGVWTDTQVNTTAASRPANHNVPGDGKFDQSLQPSDVELMVGRVDLSNMPSFGQDETTLLRRYLDKDHDYRHKVFAVDPRAVIDDNFGYFGGEAFAATGWRGFSALLGPNNVVAGDYFGLQNTTSGGGYAWSYGCGGGWYQGASGVGTTADFVNATNRNVFTVLFGSYFGDWDNQDNFLRAPLCSGWTLTNCWAGRPHWSFHPMGIGETIGYCARYSQNDSTAGGIGTRSIHIALMGDPTLRQHVIAPPTGVSAVIANGQGLVGWVGSTDPVAGYHVFRAPLAEGPFTRLSATPVIGNSFVDPAPLTGTSVYMVRATRLEVTPSGSYWNLSQGITAAACAPGTAVAQSVGLPCGNPAPQLQATPPVLGQTLAMAIAGGEASAFGQVLVGSIGSPLPVSGCELQLALPGLEVFLPVALDAAGGWSWSFLLPSDPAWNCIALDFQAAVFGTGGFALSNAMRLVTGG